MDQEIEKESLIKTVKTMVLHGIILNNTVGFDMALNALGQLGVDLNWRARSKLVAFVGKDWNSPLIIAAKLGRVDMVQRLLSHGADASISKKDEHGQMTGQTALHVAAKLGHLAVVNCLLCHGCDIDSCDVRGWTPLHYAITEDKIDVSLMLLEYGANPKVPLRFSRMNISADDRSSLMSYNRPFDFEPFPPNSFEMNCLFLSAHCHQPKLVSTLLRGYFNSEINAQNSSGRTALHEAVTLPNGFNTKDEFGIKERAETIRILLEAGLNVNIQGGTGKTALHLLFDHANQVPVDLTASKIVPDTIRQLCSKNPDFNMADCYGRTYLHQASAFGDVEILKMMIDENASFNVQDKDGNTPAHVAAYHGKFSALRILIDAGNNSDTVNRHGESVLHAVVKSKARETSKADICRELRNKVNIHQRNCSGETACELAANFKLDSIVRVLSCESTGKSRGPTELDDCDGDRGDAEFVEGGSSNTDGDWGGNQKGACGLAKGVSGSLPVKVTEGSDDVVRPNEAITNAAASEFNLPINVEQIARVCQNLGGADSQPENFQNEVTVKAIVPLRVQSSLPRKSPCEGIDLDENNDVRKVDYSDGTILEYSQKNFQGEVTVKESQDADRKILDRAEENCQGEVTVKSSVPRQEESSSAGENRYKGQGPNEVHGHQRNVQRNIPECGPLEKLEVENVEDVSKHLMQLCGKHRMGTIHIEGKQNCHERCEIARHTVSFVQRLLDYVANSNKHFKSKVLCTGSAFEGFRISKPDEFDYMCEITELSNNICEIVETDKPGFVRIQVKESHREDWKRFTSEDGFLNSAKFKRNLAEEMYKKSSAGSFHKDQSLVFNNTSYDYCSLCQPLITTSKAGVKMTLFWRGNAYTFMPIDIDVTPAIHFPGWPKSAKVPPPHVLANAADLGYHVVPKSESHDPQLWRLSFSLAELKILNNVTPIQGACYTALKIIKDQTNLRKGVRNFSHLGYIHTYLLKTKFFEELERMSDPELWQESKLTDRVCDILEATAKLLRQKLYSTVESYFLPGYNVLGTRDSLYGGL